ncbi:MAG: M48 family metalloprotease [Thermoanaerobaculia bacterium]
MRTARLATPILLLLLAAGCSVNPATGQREFNIVSEGQEISMGQEAHREVVKQFGVYDEKPELNRMVDDIGRRLAAQSDRPNLPWHFTLLDTPMINAMALPGGYIYVTRGMMERVNSEAELAGVIGHEIAHVTARHAAQRISRAQVAQFGMLLGAVIAGPQATQQYGQLAELAVSLLFQRYSRAQETQADLIGTEYMAEAKYNPIGAERMLMVLQRLDRGRTSSLDRYFMSHPDPTRRVADVRGKITELAAKGFTGLPEPDRDSYVRQLDGVITGNSTENIVIRNNTIYDRGHGLIIDAPAGWAPTVGEGMLFTMSPKNSRQQMVFQAQEVSTEQLQGYNVQDAVRRRFQEMGLQYVGSRQAATRSGDRFPIDVWAGQTEAGRVGVETTQFPHGDHVAVFLFVAPGVSQSQSPLGDILQRSEINPQRARSVEPPRMKIGTVKRGETWSDLARRATGNAGDAETIAHINGYDLKQQPPPGLTVKLPQDVPREKG